MEINDFAPVLTLMSEQEERLAKKINEVHNDVKDTNKKITDQNGRLRTVEIKVAERETYCQQRVEVFEGKLDEMVPSARAARWVAFFGKHPRMTGFLLFAIIFTAQIIVMSAFQHQWLGRLFQKLIT